VAAHAHAFAEAVLHPPPARFAAPDGLVDAASADLVLERGDVLIKFAGTAEGATRTERVIEGGQSMVRALSGLFHKEIKKGDPTCFHVALYLGKGRTAEAHGGKLSTAKVGIRSLDAHAGFLFQVYRWHDKEQALAAAEVAQTWANGRMKYKVPALVPFHLASFGIEAHGEALVFGEESRRPGGPAFFQKMFCSQFVIAVFQSAVVAAALAKKPKMLSNEVEMPAGLDLHASNASPLAFHAKIEANKAKWTHIDEVLVRGQQDVNADAAPPEEQSRDVTKELVLVGNPTAKRWPSGEWVYARNPWSLRAFEGRLYIGSGNANNPPPAPNAGPIDLWVYDPKKKDDVESKGFSVEYVVDDEQVDVFPVLSDGLWIPGEDSHVTGRDDGRVKGEGKLAHMKRLLNTAVHIPADWKLGNAHHKGARGWETLRTIPNAIHVYDLIDFGGKPGHPDLFAAISTVAGGMVAHSTDRGHTWRDALSKPWPWGRTRSLFVLDDETGPRLYASTNAGKIFRWDGKEHFGEMPVKFFPGVEDDVLVETFAARPTAFAKQVVYIGARKIIDHDWAPLGLFAATAADEARKLPLPGGALPRALAVHGGVLHALASSAVTTTETRMHVFATSDLQHWEELFHFDADTFARSFELLGEDFYFGIGCDPERLNDHTGRILKVAHASWAGDHK
jgi:hypothetical protein